MLRQTGQPSLAGTCQETVNAPSTWQTMWQPRHPFQQNHSTEQQHAMFPSMRIDVVRTVAGRLCINSHDVLDDAGDGGAAGGGLQILHLQNDVAALQACLCRGRCPVHIRHQHSWPEHALSHSNCVDLRNVQHRTGLASTSICMRLLRWELLGHNSSPRSEYSQHRNTNQLHKRLFLDTGRDWYNMTLHRRNPQEGNI